MTKRTVRKSPVLFNKDKFLLPKMEFFPLEDGTGFWLSEIGGKDLLEYNEMISKLKVESDGKELTDAQSIEIMIELIVKSACDATGHLIFSKEDMVLLSKKSPALLMDIADKAMELQGINPEATKNLKNDLTSSSTDA